ncbi:MAG: hypothetical protein ACU85U_10075 [Gammaproteobacteria bacterium]|jgi:hypothetical protein
MAAVRLLATGRGLVATCLLAAAVAVHAQAPPRYSDCAAYFFMAANAKGMGEFDRYYRSGEFAYNHAVQLAGERAALEQFNHASLLINELIERNWNLFERADERYGVVCADLYREATGPEIP